MDITLAMLAQQAAPGKGMDGITMILLMVGFLVFFYFIAVLPQNKKKKQMEKMLNSLKKGDKVVTIGGIHAKVSSAKDNEVVLKVDSNTEITFEKSAIARVVDGTITADNKKDNKKIEDTVNKKEENEKEENKN